MNAAEVATFLKGKFPSISERPSLDHPAFNISADQVLAVLGALRDEAGYDMLIDLTAVDWSVEKSPRFTVVYHLYSSTAFNYVRIAADCADDASPAMPTATGLYAGADWHERETYDLMGVTFTGHPDLRRILMWDGYPYFPLRKDFPLAGLETELSDPEIGAEIIAATGEKVRPAPMAGGPFVASPGETLMDAEPRAKDESWNERRQKP